MTQLLEYVRKLSNPFVHASVDFCFVKDEIYFEENTITNGAGFDKFSLYEFDKWLGDYMRIDGR